MSESPIHTPWRTACWPTTTSRRYGRPAGFGERTWLRQLSKKPVVDRIARGETDRRPSQNLPPTAIYCHFGAAKSLRPLESLHTFVAFRGRSGPLRHRVENRGRGEGLRRCGRLSRPSTVSRVNASTDILRGLELLTNDLAETRAFDLRKTEKLLREIRASAKRRVDLSRKPGILHIVANASIVHSASRLLYQSH